MKNDNFGFVCPPKPKNSDNLGLKRTLYALENERRFKMRELDTKKKQFLHEHHTAVSRRSGMQKPKSNTRDIMKEKIEKKREEEMQSALDLQSRSSEFIQELRAKPLSTLIKMEKKTPLFQYEEPKAPELVSIETIKQPSLSNKVISLYQKGLAGVLRREREKRASPFVQSVNTILDKLKNQNTDSKKDAMNSFTRTVLSKYAGLNAGADETISEESENVSNNASPKIVSSDNIIENKDNVDEQTIQAESDEFLETSKHSSKGLQLWARIRSEQNSVRLMKNGEDRDYLTVTNSTTENRRSDSVRIKTLGKQSLNLNILRSRSSPIRKSSQSPNRPTQSKSPTSPSILKTPRTNGSLSPGIGSVKSEGGKRDGMAQSTKKNSFSSSAKSANQLKARGGNSSIRQPKSLKQSPSELSKALPTVAVEDIDKNEQSHHTVIVVHEDNGDELCSPLQWDQSHRYSSFDGNALDKEEIEYLENLDKSTNSRQDWDHEDKIRDTLETHQSKIEDTTDDNDIQERTSTSPDTPTMEREDLPTSALSMYSGSELTTSAGTGTRTQSRQGGSGRKSRRLSVQTSGALRSLSSALTQQNKYSERMEDGPASYATVMNALADVANCVEEQARKLDNVRRATPRLVGTETNTSSTNGNREGGELSRRRSSVPTPERRNSSFVTNEVFKFLERRSSSKTMTRKKTLSKLELKLLSQAPGEDLIGRRMSLSSLNSSQRGSLDMASSTTSSARGSLSGSFIDVNSSLLEFERQKSSRRHSMSAVSERLGSASPRPTSRLSNISENDSLSRSQDFGKSKRIYSWAPDVSETTDGHVLAMELLARNNSGGVGRFRTVTHMLKWLGEEYRRQTASMMYEELRYCTYLRLAPHQIPDALKDTHFHGMFNSES